MCGIIGITGDQEPVSERLISTLKSLEYRGYDSSGLAVLSPQENKIQRIRSAGKIKELEKRFQKNKINGYTGIAHTRWATHGAPTQQNAHPHFFGKVAIVHNGIIENFYDLRKSLEKHGNHFETESDSEVIAHLLNHMLNKTKSVEQAFSKTLNALKGAYAFAALIENAPHKLFVARKGSPLVIGQKNGESFVASDALAINAFTQSIIYLEEGDWAVLEPEHIQIYNQKNQKTTRQIHHLSSGPALAEKGNYRHFMLKEIHEEADAFSRTLALYANAYDLESQINQKIDFKNITALNFIACGSAYYTCLAAKYWFERCAGIPTHVEIASEFRYRAPALNQDTLVFAVSQSGETADTLAALIYAKNQGLKTVSLVNIAHSSIARASDITLKTHAGPEIGVASTKAFLAQLIALASLAIQAGKQRKTISKEQEKSFIHHFFETPRLLSELIDQQEENIKTLTDKLSQHQHVIYLGRGVHYPIALEGALKLKEIAYIYAEGFPAGELKHGSIALIDKGTPVITIAPYNSLFEKTLSNMEEVSARGANVILLSDQKGLNLASNLKITKIEGPSGNFLSTPILYTPLIHLLAYYTAIHKGTDIDQPRNLAKSVTVE